MTRLYVFDADDTLRRTRVPGQPCPHAPDEWTLLPGVHERLSRMPWDRLHLGVASNQDHVGYGLLSEDACRGMLEALVAVATDGRARPRIAICPHPAELGCGCRKPAPGLLLRLTDAFGVPPGETLFVGDAPTDAEAAARAGVRFAWARDFFRR